MNATRNFRRLRTETEAAIYIGMSRAFLRESRMAGRRKGRTPGPDFIRIQRTIRYDLADLNRWIAENKYRVSPDGPIAVNNSNQSND